MTVWILTSRYNDYDQHGEYFEAVFAKKPTSEEIQKVAECSPEYAERILKGGGRKDFEYQWYLLVEHAI